MTNLSGALPSGDANGLDAIVQDLVGDPTKIHVVVALVDVVKKTYKVDTGETVPTIRVRRIEAITEDRHVLERLLQRAFEKRTGMATLPFELEADVEEALADVEETEEDGA